MESNLPPVQALRRSLWMVVQAAPLELRNLALINLITGVGPSISLFLGKLVIDEVSGLLKSGATVGLQDRSLQAGFQFLVEQPKLIWAIGASVLLGLVVDAIDSVGPTLFGALGPQSQSLGPLPDRRAVAPTCCGNNNTYSLLCSSTGLVACALGRQSHA